MKHQARTQTARGATLVEAVISISVLAVAIPLVFGALAEAGKTSGDSDSANRSTVIVAECLHAVERARDGSPGWFDPSPTGTSFPPDGDVWALAFGEDGRVIARIDQNEYDSGVRSKEDQTVRYIARVSAQPQSGSGRAQANQDELAPLLQLTIQLEYPAFQEADERKSQRFHSLLR